jgi:hypothetical protein
MAKRKVRAVSIRKNDLRSWNFIIFLTLAFILLVVVLSAMSRLTLDVRSKAGLACTVPAMPRAEDCSIGWTFKRDSNGCLKYFCYAPTVTPTK